jgi:RNA polymerase sigma factor (TIGR02999 family)
VPDAAMRAMADIQDDKHKHRRGIQDKNASNTPPVNEFCQFVLSNQRRNFGAKCEPFHRRARKNMPKSANPIRVSPCPMPSVPDSIPAHFEASYQDLRRIARAQLHKHQRTGLLDTTGLVHESYLRYSQSNASAPDDKRHFLQYAAKVMRSVIVDAARARNAGRRGGEFEQTTLNSGILENVTLENGLLKINEAVDLLHAADPRMAQIVELRFFAGLTAAETAEVLGISLSTLYREWEKARLILMDAIDSQ